MNKFGVILVMVTSVGLAAIMAAAHRVRFEDGLLMVWLGVDLGAVLWSANAGGARAGGLR